MRTKGSPEWLEAVRRLAVARVLEGYEVAEVADFLKVHVCTVHRWVACHRKGGEAALAAVVHPGPAPRLTARQTARVLSWVKDKRPQDFGFLSGHWTARRVAAVVERRMRVRFNHRFFSHWLSRHGISPQIPDAVPRERDEAVIRHWRRYVWPYVKGGRVRRARPLFSRTRAGC